MKKISILLLGIVAFWSCSENLTQSPSDQLPSDQAIQTITDLSNAVNGAYNLMATNQGSYAGYYGIYADGEAGELRSLQAANHFSPIIRLQCDQNSEFSDQAYYTIYVSLARINDILTVYDGVSAETDAEKARKNDLKGQLLALKALYHFDAARIFAQLPTAAADINAANSGVVISNAKYPVSQKFKRSTLKETYDFIITQLNEAKPLLSKTRAVGKFDYWSATALLSRVYLYNGNYNDALKNAEEVISSGPFKLYTTQNYTSVWSKEGTDESILEVITTDLTNADRLALGYLTTPDGYSEAAASNDFSQFLLATPNDVRTNMIKQYASGSGQYLAYWPMKYPGKAGSVSPQYVNNPKLIRLSELYLIAAEAIVKGATSSKGKAAVDYYNDLRGQRITGYVNVTSVTLPDILNERRRELFCENHRLFDLIRNKTDIPSNPTISGIISYTDYRFIAAIPQREIDINPEMKQNNKY